MIRKYLGGHFTAIGSSLKMDDAVWGVPVFTNNRERLIEGAVNQRFRLKL
jgi:hypothetical protein